MTIPTPPDLLGATLGPYRITREIGRGGMAIVYEAYQASLNRTVAIKVLPQQFTFDREFVARFQQEARSAAQLSHPNIVPIYDVGQQDGWYYIVMQHLTGEPLSALLARDGALPLARASRIIEQIASALDYAHGRGIVHRDVKPANIIVGPRDVATLTDFGLARAAEASALTRSGTLVGTPEYMSPEQVQGAPATSASDRYALGIVLYEMLTGQRPFSAATLPALLFKQVYESPPPARALAADLPVDVDAVLAKALAKQPESRYQTACDMVAALPAVAIARGDQRKAASRPTPPRPLTTPMNEPAAETRLMADRTAAATPIRRHPRLALIAAAAAMVLAVAVGGIVLFVIPALQPAEPPPVAIHATTKATAAATITLAVGGSRGPGALTAQPATPLPTGADAPAAATPTISGGPTSTLAPLTSTQTPMPARGARPLSSPGSVGSSPTTQSRPQRLVSPPKPLTPGPGANENGEMIKFAWAPGPHPLGATEAYAVLLWPEKDQWANASGLDLPTPFNACDEKLTKTEREIEGSLLGGDPWNNYGRYAWTVVIIDWDKKDPGRPDRCQVVSEQAAANRFTYTPPGPSCGGSKSGECAGRWECRNGNWECVR